MKEHEFFEDLMDSLSVFSPTTLNEASGIKINPTSYEGKICNVDLENLIKDEIKKYDNNRIFSDDILTELLADNLKDLRNKLTKELEEELAREKRKDVNHFIAKIDKVYFGKGTTVIKWKDGTSTKVKCQDGEEFDKEKGVAMCIIKHMFGDIGYYNEIFKSLNLDEDIAETKPEVKKTKPKKVFFTLGDIFGF